jgi:hypothetical protein
MTRRGQSPRDYALLVRQKSDDYENELAGPLVRADLRLRNEGHALGRTTLQNLLADEFCRITIALFRLGAQWHAPEAWRLASNALQDLRVVDPENELAYHKVEAQLTGFLGDLRVEMARAAPRPESSGAFAARLFTFPFAKAPAIDSPPMPAPTTTARRPKKPLICYAPTSSGPVDHRTQVTAQFLPDGIALRR